MKLYIIGNGFDLHHGLPTSAKAFYECAREKLDELKNYFRFDIRKSTPWYDFEEALGKFDSKRFYDEHDNTDVSSEDFRLSEVYSLEDELREQADDLVDGIRLQFAEWIEGIDVAGSSRPFVFEDDSRFITFNYTSTLQEVYGIDDQRIWHIHGRAGLNELIFGHGETPTEEPEFDAESGESNRTIFSDADGAAAYPLYALKKPVQEVIQKNERRFAELHEVTEVEIVGHSLNDIDVPYYRELAKYLDDVTWTVYCYAPSDWDHHSGILRACGIRSDKIKKRAYK